MEKSTPIIKMLEITLSDFHQLVLSDIKSTFEKIDSSNIMNEIHGFDKRHKQIKLSENIINLVRQIKDFRHKLKNDLEKIEKSYNENREKNQNE